MPFGFGSKKAEAAPADVNIEPLTTDSASDPDNKNVDFPEKTVDNTIPAPGHEDLSDEAAAHRLRLFRAAAENDPNLSVGDLEDIDYAVGGHDVGRENELVDALVENSPYPEVRSNPYTPESIMRRQES